VQPVISGDANNPGRESDATFISEQIQAAMFSNNADCYWILCKLRCRTELFHSDFPSRKKTDDLRMSKRDLCTHEKIAQTAHATTAEIWSRWHIEWQRYL